MKDNAETLLYISQKENKRKTICSSQINFD